MKIDYVKIVKDNLLEEAIRLIEAEMSQTMVLAPVEGESYE